MVHRVLPVGFQPTEYDVVCGRGKGSYLRPGNVKFRSIVASYSKQYITLKSKEAKSTFIDLIINKVRMQNHGYARFVKQLEKDGVWVELDEAETREKVGHLVRAECLQISCHRSVQTPLRSPIVQQQQQPEKQQTQARPSEEMEQPSKMKAAQSAKVAQVVASDCFRLENIPSFNAVGNSSSIVGTTSPACIDPNGSQMMTARKSTYANMLLLCNNLDQEDTWDYANTIALARIMAPVRLLTTFSSSSRPDDNSVTTKQDDILMQIPIHDPFPFRSESNCFRIFEDEVPLRAEDFFTGSDDILDAIDVDDHQYNA